MEAIIVTLAVITSFMWGYACGINKRDEDWQKDTLERSITKFDEKTGKLVWSLDGKEVQGS